MTSQEATNSVASTGVHAAEVVLVHAGTIATFCSGFNLFAQSVIGMLTIAYWARVLWRSTSPTPPPPPVVKIDPPK